MISSSIYLSKMQLSTGHKGVAAACSLNWTTILRYYYTTPSCCWAIYWGLKLCYIRKCFLYNPLVAQRLQPSTAASVFPLLIYFYRWANVLWDFSILYNCLGDGFKEINSPLSFFEGKAETAYMDGGYICKKFYCLTGAISSPLTQQKPNS